MHTRVKLLEGMQMKTILKLLGGDTVKLLGGIYPPSPPGFGTPYFGIVTGESLELSKFFERMPSRKIFDFNALLNC